MYYNRLPNEYYSSSTQKQYEPVSIKEVESQVLPKVYYSSSTQKRYEPVSIKEVESHIYGLNNEASKANNADSFVSAPVYRSPSQKR
jgi:hypothetical protein